MNISNLKILAIIGYEVITEKDLRRRRVEEELTLRVEESCFGKKRRWRDPWEDKLIREVILP